MAKPQIVLVPGAWHGPEAFATVSSELQALGYNIHSRQFPAVGHPGPDTPKDLSEDIAALRAIVEEAIGEGRDVVVIAHSWGGIVAGTGLAGLGKQEREAAGKKGGVVRAAYIAAFILPVGVCLVDTFQHKIPGWWEIEVRCLRNSIEAISTPFLPSLLKIMPLSFC